ncbi:hypothetical protein J6595_07020 [Jiella sp. KSK16Y-1]|uniref:Glycine zipper domain-containing protein n=2 Tax=Jiella mangrovi TaxID=2821407 RepID=A0ABS4BEZ4_9HYPH|nr:hypothetical protein [Jiella mangrovi]
MSSTDEKSPKSSSSEDVGAGALGGAALGSVIGLVGVGIALPLVTSGAGALIGGGIGYLVNRSLRPRDVDGAKRPVTPEVAKEG